MFKFILICMMFLFSCTTDNVIIENEYMIIKRSISNKMQFENDTITKNDIYVTKFFVSQPESDRLQERFNFLVYNINTPSTYYNVGDTIQFITQQRLRYYRRAVNQCETISDDYSGLLFALRVYKDQLPKKIADMVDSLVIKEEGIYNQ